METGSNTCIRALVRIYHWVKKDAPGCVKKYTQGAMHTRNHASFIPYRRGTSRLEAGERESLLLEKLSDSSRLQHLHVNVYYVNNKSYTCNFVKLYRHLC